MIDKSEISYDLSVAKEYLDNLIEVVERDGFVAPSYLKEKIDKVITHLGFVETVEDDKDEFQEICEEAIIHAEYLYEESIGK